MKGTKSGVTERQLQLSPRLAAQHIGERVRMEQVRLFWSSGFLMSALAIGIAVALVIAQWPVIERTHLLAWAGLLGVATLPWAGLTWYFRQQPASVDSAGTWLTLALAIALTQGLTWGLAGWILFPPDNMAHQAILTVMLAGVAAGAVTSLSPIGLAATLFLVPALIPLCYRLAFEGGEDALLMLAIVLVLLLTLILSNRHLYTTLRDNLQLRIEKATREAALHESEARYRLMFEQSPLGIVHYDEHGEILACNTTLIEILGTRRADMIGSNMITEVNDERMASAVRLSLETGWGYYEDTYDPVKGIHKVPLRAFFNSITDPDGNIIGGVGIIEDFTQRKQAEEALNYQAFHDTVTGLPNRRLLHDRLDQALNMATRNQRIGALMFLDLDYFKRINDWLGHHQGDQVLTIVAERLSMAMRGEDTVARLSGDEFILLAPDLGPDETVATRALNTITERIQELLQEPMTIGGRELRLSASIGITLFPQRDATPEQLLRQSDTAMYVAKKDVRGEVRFHDVAMDANEEERLGLESELSSALESGELEIVFQPIVDAEGRLLTCEALLRWHHAEHGDIPPGRFIPVAEASGLIVALGRWVVDQCCSWIAGLDPAQREGIDRVAINVSAREFHHPEFARKIEETLDRHGLDGSWLTLEVTENVLIDRVSTTIRRMQRLKQRGVRFEVDDFGTGYSSLTYLKRLPVDGIKIDHSFIHDAPHEPGSSAIIDAILAMASRLQLDVAAEGVETTEQLAFLRERECQRFQGFLFARPMPAEQLLAYLATHKRP